MVRSTGKNIATIGKRLMGTLATGGIMLDLIPTFPRFRIMSVGTAEDVRENGPVDLWQVLGQIEQEL